MLVDDQHRQPTKTNWTWRRQLLFQTGFADVWYAQGSQGVDNICMISLIHVLLIKHGIHIYIYIYIYISR
jgi:hypothetical protein